MRPNPHHYPAELTKASIGVGITGAIGFDLRSPEFGVFLWPSGMQRASVPEASIDENCDARTKEGNICDPSRF
jgi:hypothetical protein